MSLLLIDSLRTELERRKAKNARYSLRAFARDLEISPSHLVLILDQKRKLSAVSAIRMMDHLHLSPSHSEKIMTEIFPGDASDKVRLRSVGAKSKLPLESEKALECLTEWWHFAIFSLSGIERYVGTPEWIAAQLGLSLEQVNQALRDLQSFGAMALSGDKWVRVRDSFYIRMDERDDERQKRQTLGFLDRYRSEVENHHMESFADKRIIINLTISGSMNDARKLEDRLRGFLEEVQAELKSEAPMKDVYQLSFGLFPLTRPN